MVDLVLRNFLSPGDTLMLTAAVRDLHRAAPGRYRTDVRTPTPDLWRHNPYLTALEPSAPGVRTLDCDYPLIHQSCQSPHHFIQGFPHFLAEKLGCEIPVTEFRGDIHLAAEERSTPLPAAPDPQTTPYWVVVSGGKYDFTIKWWHRRRWQETVDALAGRLHFVQVGAPGDYQPPLRGSHVTDLRGRTSVRELIRLVYFSDGVLCPVTFLMHLAAAVPVRPDAPSATRPCVVVAGGRESPHWEAYPHHRFLHTVGSLPCCAGGGCWKARTIPLGDGGAGDEPEALCASVAPNGMPRCMDLIGSHDVTRAIESYLTTGASRIF